MNFVIFLRNVDEFISEFCEEFYKIAKTIKNSRYFDKNAIKIRNVLDISGIDAQVHSFTSFVASYPSKVCETRGAPKPASTAELRDASVQLR